MNKMCKEPVKRQECLVQTWRVDGGNSIWASGWGRIDEAGE
jgi:hypothetical protein